jgi:hypothetical protein
MTLFFSNIKFFKFNKVEIDRKKLKNLIRMLSILGAISFYLSIDNVLGVYNIKDIIILGNQGKLRHLVNFNSGYTAQYVLLIISSALGANEYFDLKKESTRLIKQRIKKIEIVGIIFINTTLIVLYSSVLMSRIIIIQYTIVMLVIYAKNNNIKVKKMILYGVLALAFLIVTNGYRDYNAQGYLYTDSPINWGIHRIMDYYLSTLNYSFDIIEHYSLTIELKAFLPIINRIFGTELQTIVRNINVASGEYTNIGGIGYLFSKLNYLIFGYAFIYAIIINLFRNLYKSNSLVGLLVYPLVIYSMLEIPRIIFIPSLVFNFYLGLVIIVNFYLRFDIKRI